MDDLELAIHVLAWLQLAIVTTPCPRCGRLIDIYPVMDIQIQVGVDGSDQVVFSMTCQACHAMYPDTAAFATVLAMDRSKPPSLRGPSHSIGASSATLTVHHPAM